MKDRIPEFTKEYFPYEEIPVALGQENAYSTGRDLGGHYVEFCNDRNIENCNVCSVRKDCIKKLT